MRERNCWQWCMLDSGEVSNETEAHPVIVPAAACGYGHICRRTEIIQLYYLSEKGQLCDILEISS